MVQKISTTGVLWKHIKKSSHWSLLKITLLKEITILSPLLVQKKLDSVVTYRTNVQTRLEQHVQTLDQLNSALHLLEELRDMENKIDGIYLPLETMYLKLRWIRKI